MALGAPTYSAGGGGGGKIGTTPIGKGGGLSPQQQAINSYLEGASGMNLAQYNNALAGIGAQRNAAMGAYGAAAGAANADYGLTLRGIEQDLRFGNQLRGQEQYRNVDLGRQRSALDLWNATQQNQVTQADIAARQGFANRGFGLANQQTRAQYDTGTRNLLTDAISRGARTAAGTLAASSDIFGERSRGLAKNRLDLDTTRRGLQTESQRSSYALEFANRGNLIDQKTFNSIAATYGIQAAQAAAQAALAKDRAGANRSAALGNAGAGRNSALAGLGAQQSGAFNNYLQQQMALMQQLYGF